jgi:hypothetical protein
MEPIVKRYLIRILNTLSVGLFWLAINSTAGIMYDLAFVHDHIMLKNILFYIWFLLSLAGFIWYVVWLWSKPLKLDEDE